MADICNVAVPTTVPALLRAAAEVVRRRGYAMGQRHTSDGLVCAIGAVEVALRLDEDGRAETHSLAMQTLSALHGHISPRVIVGSHYVLISSVAGWSNNLEEWLGSREKAAKALAWAFEAAAASLEAGKGA